MAKIKISKIRLNPKNPRFIRDDKFDKLVKSLENFPEMMEARPIIIDENNIILGGNMRFRALKELGFKEVDASWIKQIKGLSKEQKDQFIIKDNASFGEWDWDLLANNWSMDDLDSWGLDLPLFTTEPPEEKETEKLSQLEYDPMYYEPENVPEIKLEDCVDLDKFNAKVKALDEYKLSKKQKDLLKIFAYRFIKIDFESIANYYAFKATDEEKKAIERLRLVLTDNGLDGFVEDDLLSILGQFKVEDKDEQDD